MTEFLQYLVGGLATGSVYGLIALGFVLLAGLGLFFVLGRRTPVVIHPEVEVVP